MLRRDPSHLDEWATLLEADVSEELLDDGSDAETVFRTEETITDAGDEAR